MSKVLVEEALIKEKRFMLYIANRLVKGDYHEAEDLVSSATILALERKKDFYEGNINKFNTWIKYIIMTARHSYKFNRRTIMESLEYSSNFEIEDENIPDFDTTNTILLSVVQSLPYPNIAMWRYMGYMNKEITEFTGTSVTDIERKARANREYYNENHNQQ